MCLQSFDDWREENGHLNYLIDFCEAIKKVKQEYYTADYNNRVQKPERVFAYELYHQFRLKTGENQQGYNNLRLNAELEKNILHGDYITFNIVPIKNHFTPDLVLHHSQNEFQEHQELVVEIKASNKTSTEIQKDIVKLFNYVYTLNFKIAVFLIFNEGVNLSAFDVFNPHLEGNEEQFGKIYVVNSYFPAVEDIYPTIKISTLKNILEYLADQ